MNTPATPNPSRTRWNRWDWALLLFSLLIAAWAFYEARYEYFSGHANRDSLQLGGLLFLLFGCAAWFTPLMFAALRILLSRPTFKRGLGLLGLGVLPLVVGFGTHWLSDGGAVQYDRGFNAWIIREVNPVPIQAWLQTRAIPPDALQLPPADWPPEIQRLKPERVDLWRDRGVVLTWGRVAHDGDRRQVFIGRTATTPPPTEVLWVGDDGVTDAWVPIQDHWPSDWLAIKPGVWWWLISGS